MLKLIIDVCATPMLWTKRPSGMYIYICIWICSSNNWYSIVVEDGKIAFWAYFSLGFERIPCKNVSERPSRFRQEVLDAGTLVWRRTWMRWTYGPCGAWPPAIWLESSVRCKSDTPTKIKVVLHRWIFLAVWGQRLGVLPNFTHLRAKLRNIACHVQVTQVTCCHLRP